MQEGDTKLRGIKASMQAGRPQMAGMQEDDRQARQVGKKARNEGRQYARSAGAGSQIDGKHAGG